MPGAERGMLAATTLEIELEAAGQRSSSRGRSRDRESPSSPTSPASWWPGSAMTGRGGPAAAPPPPGRLHGAGRAAARYVERHRRLRLQPRLLPRHLRLPPLQAAAAQPGAGAGVVGWARPPTPCSTRACCWPPSWRRVKEEMRQLNLLCTFHTLCTWGYINTRLGSWPINVSDATDLLTEPYGQLTTVRPSYVQHNVQYNKHSSNSPPQPTGG